MGVIVPSRPRILVVTCGNPLAGDDAFGTRLAEELRLSPVDGVEVVDLAMNPLSLPDHLQDRDALIVVDAAMVPDTPPGQLIECDWDDPHRPQLVSEAFLSTHGMSIAYQVELARATGLLPPLVRLLVATIHSAALGGPMAPEVERSVGSAVESIRQAASAMADGAALSSKRAPGPG